MAINISKNASVATYGNGQLIALFNGVNTEEDIYYFYDAGQTDTKKPLYKLNLRTYSDMRCLKYALFYGTTAAGQINHTVLMNPRVSSTSNDGVIQLKPLFQTINVQAKCDKTIGLLATFWSNVSQTVKKAPTLIMDDGSIDLSAGNICIQGGTLMQLQYDQDVLIKYKYSEYDLFQVQTSENRVIFCSSKIDSGKRFRVLTESQKNSGYPLKDIVPQTVLIAEKPIVLSESVEKYPILDFAGVGGTSQGGGMKNHYHIPTVDGSNYAFAVFHPGTAMPQLPWQTL